MASLKSALPTATAAAPGKDNNVSYEVNEQMLSQANEAMITFLNDTSTALKHSDRPLIEVSEEQKQQQVSALESCAEKLSTVFGESAMYSEDLKNARSEITKGLGQTFHDPAIVMAINKRLPTLFTRQQITLLKHEKLNIDTSIIYRALSEQKQKEMFANLGKCKDAWQKALIPVSEKAVSKAVSATDAEHKQGKAAPPVSTRRVIQINTSQVQEIIAAAARAMVLSTGQSPTHEHIHKTIEAAASISNTQTMDASEYNEAATRAQFTAFITQYMPQSMSGQASDAEADPLGLIGFESLFFRPVHRMISSFMIRYYYLLEGMLIPEAVKRKLAVTLQSKIGFIPLTNDQPAYGIDEAMRLLLAAVNLPVGGKPSSQQPQQQTDEKTNAAATPTTTSQLPLQIIDMSAIRDKHVTREVQTHADDAAFLTNMSNHELVQHIQTKIDLLTNIRSLLSYVRTVCADHANKKSAKFSEARHDYVTRRFLFLAWWLQFCKKALSNGRIEVFRMNPALIEDDRIPLKLFGDVPDMKEIGIPGVFAATPAAAAAAASSTNGTNTAAAAPNTAGANKAAGRGVITPQHREDFNRICDFINNKVRVYDILKEMTEDRLSALLKAIVDIVMPVANLYWRFNAGTLQEMHPIVNTIMIFTMEHKPNLIAKYVVDNMVQIQETMMKCFNNDIAQAIEFFKQLNTIVEATLDHAAVLNDVFSRTPLSQQDIEQINAVREHTQRMRAAMGDILETVTGTKPDFATKPDSAAKPDPKKPAQ